jgi:S-(hydroxymethyl)glutathione dehydrogenase / alcohol dehydrogenase
MKTTAAVLTEIGKPLELMQLEIPSLKPGQVLVSIKHSSICQSQMNEINGRKGEDRFLPHTLGHEGSGIVLEIGPDIKKVKPGNSVVLSWIKSSGQDAPSTKYTSHGLTVNSGPISTFLETAIISENRLIPLNDFPLELMPLMGCALPTGYGLVRNTLKPQPGSSIAIWGMGGVGMSAVLAAAALECTTIIAIDLVPEKLDLAIQLGATHIVNGMQDPVTQILQLTNGKGVDFGIDASGSIKAIEAGFASIKSAGGKFIIAGNPPHGEKLQLNPFDFISGKQLAGTWGGDSHMDLDVHHFVEKHKKGVLPFGKLVTHIYPFPEINSALDMMNSGRAGRVMLNMPG